MIRHFYVYAFQDGATKFFSLEESKPSDTSRESKASDFIRVDADKVPSALGEMGVQFNSELEAALIKLAKLPADDDYRFRLSDEARDLSSEIFRLSSDIFGDHISEKAWNAALATT